MIPGAGQRFPIAAAVRTGSAHPQQSNGGKLLLMTSPRTITLFEEHPDSGRSHISFAASTLIHGGFIALIAFAILYTPRIDHRLALNRYNLRRLDLRTPDQLVRRSAAGQVNYPGPWPKAPAAAAGGKQVAQDAVLPTIPHVHHGPQTLMQPDLKTDVTLQQLTPVPQVVLWKPANQPVAKIVAPLPAKPPVANVPPTLRAPNHETNLADIPVSSVPLPSLKQVIPPSTTAPLVVHGPQPVPSTPATVSQPTATPTPAAVLSLSDVKMKNGTATLPPVNEVAATSTTGAFSLSPGTAKAPTAAGNGNPANKAPGNGSAAANATAARNDQSHAGAGSAIASTAPGSGAGAPVAGQGQSSGLAPQGGNAGADQGDQPTATQISLPRDGHFGSVIIGASIEDQFPEVTDVWKGRMAYTVYLHVGLEKSWILQYSLPRSADAQEAGTVAHLEAPWPYNIVRPNLAPDSIDTDALMIHGYVNDSGRFETLNVVFPPQFTQAKFVLDSLEHWQFRPASLNGQVAKVEVLLIIPEEFE